MNARVAELFRLKEFDLRHWLLRPRSLRVLKYRTVAFRPP
jgi:hypothetical protein